MLECELVWIGIIHYAKIWTERFAKSLCVKHFSWENGIFGHKNQSKKL